MRSEMLLKDNKLKKLSINVWRVAETKDLMMRLNVPINALEALKEDFSANRILCFSTSGRGHVLRDRTPFSCSLLESSTFYSFMFCKFRLHNRPKNTCKPWEYLYQKLEGIERGTIRPRGIIPTFL
mmetsp:Transcript_62493/g.71689  ORF Transcript_62493/g.71689 Transcript_62493/m.71689 type:complete len:126 (+) Transcript_62493:609-986(+)